MIAAGTEVYQIDSAPVVARGCTYTEAEITAALGDEVSKILYDEDGTAELETLLAGLGTTAFAIEGINRVLTNENLAIADWRVGEAIAEAFLIAHRNCVFPWPMGRDLRNPNASPAGTDLVGFQKIGQQHRFAFGEVKTSGQELSPPGVVTGRHGLHKQVESLRDTTTVKNSLLRYLGYHATNAEWRPLYMEAAGKYLAESTDISLFGILIRDTEPNELDLSARAKSLAAQCPAATSIELRAKYLTRGCVPGLPARVRNPRGANANN